MPKLMADGQEAEIRLAQSPRVADTEPAPGLWVAFRRRVCERVFRTQC